MKIGRKLPWLLLLLMLSASARAAGQGASSSSGSQGDKSGTPAAGSSGGADSTAPAKIDPAKEAAIRQLLDAAGVAAAINQLMDGMMGSMKQIMTNSLPPGEYREKLIDLFLEKYRTEASTLHMLDMAVVIYDKYLSMEDVKGLIQFYSTPLGQKTVQSLPKMTADLQSQGLQWGQTVARQTMLDVLSEHPDLAKALDDAQK